MNHVHINKPLGKEFSEKKLTGDQKKSYLLIARKCV